jgi:hypothetical protein
MVVDHRAGVWINRRLQYGPPLAITLFILFALGVVAWEAKADYWTGAGQSPINQIRDWNNKGNWMMNSVPPATDYNIFSTLGDGQIDLNGLQQASIMDIGHFASPNFAPGSGGQLNFVPDPANPGYPAAIYTGEGVRDMYGVDYFATGPQFSTPIGLPLDLSIELGAFPPGAGAKSSLLISGNLLAETQDTRNITYTGYNSGSSLWITSYNEYYSSGSLTVQIQDGGPADPGNSHTLHLADDGRLNGATIVLNGATTQLGLHDNQQSENINFYGNTVISYNGGVIFTDRSYQQNPFDATINAVEPIDDVRLKGMSATVDFGAGPSATFGKTNNGFSTFVHAMHIDDLTETGAQVNVWNGNLTQEYAGSRYISGANRLQEAHNYVDVDNLFFEVPVPPAGGFVKGGAGVLWVRHVNWLGSWPTAPTVSAGVLRLGDPGGEFWSPTPHSMPAGQSLNLSTSDAAVGIAWDTQINLSASAPFAIQPAPAPALGTGLGQRGAVDIDLWNFGLTVPNVPTINTNVLDPTTQQMTYLRVGSSMGADASFDPQPTSIKHASVAYQNQQGMQTQIVPWIPAVGHPTYYFGGGGGTLQIDSQLTDYEQAELGTTLEMGTTGNLLPGRIALNPGGDVSPDVKNTYSGMTHIVAGTLQLMKQHAIYGTSGVDLDTYDLDILGGLYKNPWYTNATWEGPGQLLLDPVLDPENTNYKDWNLTWYTAAGGAPLLNVLQLNGGVIGWTGDVDIPSVPGIYNLTNQSDLTGALQWVNVLGLGGEYSAGIMTTQFQITDNIPTQGEPVPVLLYKAGKNSVLDLRQTPVTGAGPLDVNTYTGGTIIAGGEIIVNDARQLNAAEEGTGGPIAILNGGRLHFTEGDNYQIYVNVPIKINTDGTPDTVKNCGSVIEVDEYVETYLMSNFDFSWNPTAYLEKDGPGTLYYAAPAPPAVSQGQGQANAWGLKLTYGTVSVNQLPVNPGADSGPVIFNNGNLVVTQAPEEVPTADPAYGFRNIVSFPSVSIVTVQNNVVIPQSNDVIVDDNALFRTHGIVPNEILGSVHFRGQDADGDPSNNVVHLSRNMASTANPETLGDYSRGNGAMSFENVTVYMTGGGQNNLLNVLPRDAGFSLQLNDGAVFNASHQNNVYGEVQFYNSDPTDPGKFVRIDGEEASADRLTLTADTWTIYGTGLTSWTGVIEKVGTGTVQFHRSLGAPVIVNSDALLLITDGTLIARSTADPFTDNTFNPGFSLDIENNSTASGLQILRGIKTVDQLYGTGNTLVDSIGGTGGTELIATSIVQNTLTIGAGCTVTIKAIPGGPSASGDNLTPVPEPATWILLILAAAGISSWKASRSRRTKR